jgi:hypothetical protein
LYFPETFNDFIESAELIAIVEVFAYMAELLAYRLDINAHENFISTAQRKDSILRLAKLVSYSAARPLPARGLVKITSINTTESVVDANGTDLANQTIMWNDSNNLNWKDQFSLIINRALDQDFGSVGPTDRFQLQNVLFETYSFNLVPLQGGVFTYTATVNGRSVPMELVSVAYDTSLGIIERRPQINANFALLYGQDGLGDSSGNTGFFCFTKQGNLKRFRTSFDGITPNQTYEINADNVNDTDIWVNNVDAGTGELLDTPSTLPYRRQALTGKSGEWVQVDLAHAQNVIFNTNPNRNKYEVETQADNRVRLLFGDGEFADIPSGAFDVWARTSINEDLLIPQSAVVDNSNSFTYVDPYGRTQTFTFTYSLVNSLQNASAAEDIEHIRTTAPAVYYSQDRMVNGEDYNVFLLQDPSILKLRAINRTFAGDSKYIKWHDASGTYENVKIFGDDGILYFQNNSVTVTTPVIDNNVLISSYMEPLLSSTDLFLQLAASGVTTQQFRRTFSVIEISSIQGALAGTPPSNINLYYNLTNHSWYAIRAGSSLSDPYPSGLGNIGYNVNPGLSQFINVPLITVTQLSIFETKYTVTRTAKRIVFESPTTKFWNANSADKVVNYDSLRSSVDTINILQSNLNNNRTSVMKSNWTFNVLGQEINSFGTDIGLPDENRLSVLPQDVNQDGIPDNIRVDEYVNTQGVSDIIMPKIKVTATGVLTLPIAYVAGHGDVQLVNVNGAGAVIAEVGAVDSVQTTVTVSSLGTNTSILIAVRDYVYFTRLSIADKWSPAPTTIASITAYVADRLAVANLWKREEGRSNLNFAWIHNSPRYYLVDPAASNLIDAFVITKGYFLSIKRWLEDPLAIKPDMPTPLDLRTSYGYLLDNKMISDTAIMHPGRFKILFGTRAEPPLQAVFKVVRSADRTLTDNQIKTIMVTTIRNFFNVSLWEFGETFFFSELAAAIHAALPTEISAVVLVPILRENHFGTLYQILAREDEVFYPDITVNDIELVASLNAQNLNLSQEQLLLNCNPQTAPTPTTYTLSTNVPTVNEGGTVRVTLTTTNVADGTSFAYTINGPGITTGDFVGALLTGTFVVTNNTAFIDLVTKADQLTEGPETATVALDNGGANVSFIINDTSQTPPAATYVLSSTAPLVGGVRQVNEGDNLSITLTTTNVPAGTVIPWTATGAGITPGDFTGRGFVAGPQNPATTSPNATTGNFTIGSDGKSTLIWFVAADGVTEGDEIMHLALTNGKAAIDIKIKDTSTGAAAPPPPAATLTITPSYPVISGTVGAEILPILFTVNNTGGLSANVSNISFFNPNATYRVTGNVTPTTIQPGGNTQFSVYYTPTVSGTSTNNTVTANSPIGNVVATVTINAALGGPHIVEFYTVPTAITLGQTIQIFYRVTGDTANDILGYNTLASGFQYVPTSMGVLRSIIDTPPAVGNIPILLRANDGTTTDTATIYIQVNAASPATPPPPPPPPAPPPPITVTATSPSPTFEIGSGNTLLSARVQELMNATGVTAGRYIASTALVSGSVPAGTVFTNDNSKVYIDGQTMQGAGTDNTQVWSGVLRVTDNVGTFYDVAFSFTLISHGPAV